MSLGDFKSHLFNLKGIDNNHPRFNCIVTYNSKHGTVSDNTVAMMSVNTNDHGNIHLTGTNKIGIDRYHLDFSDRFQSYSFSGDGLNITGKSPKMGSYTVTIVPTSAC